MGVEDTRYDVVEISALCTAGVVGGLGSVDTLYGDCRRPRVAGVVKR